MGYIADRVEGRLPQPNNQSLVQIDIGHDASVEEVRWWQAILGSDDRWDATVKYNGHIYLSYGRFRQRRWNSTWPLRMF
ncbi:unnamed protein product [Penicillium roqueforti FM164]|uniref:Genomic scaffold, ProqFM164S01 n=1 Tax=Penicillium roqueforti (strain FM164) TaxID=1365484 RepID=W6PWF3_PENRF|nr:unnamed protein product [Penicillium roqueforti FM164]